jgi:hypothetical protein
LNVRYKERDGEIERWGETSRAQGAGRAEQQQQRAWRERRERSRLGGRATHLSLTPPLYLSSQTWTTRPTSRSTHVRLLLCFVRERQPSVESPPPSFSFSHTLSNLSSFHTGGATLEAALAEAGLGLFHYMTPITGLAATAER